VESKLLKGRRIVFALPMGRFGGDRVVWKDRPWPGAKDSSGLNTSELGMGRKKKTTKEKKMCGNRFGLMVEKRVLNRYFF